MGINIAGGADITVTKPLLNFFQASISMSWIVALRQTPLFTIMPTSANAYSMPFRSV